MFQDENRKYREQLGIPYPRNGKDMNNVIFKAKGNEHDLLITFLYAGSMLVMC